MTSARIIIIVGLFFACNNTLHIITEEAVEHLCAMTKTALPEVCMALSRASWTAASLSASNALVASAAKQAIN